jgi:hypothetical protein
MKCIHPDPRAYCKKSDGCSDCDEQPAAASNGYARPRTRGELRDLLNSGVPCEVVSDVAEMTEILLKGWLGMYCFEVRPSENKGWSVFEKA